MKYVILIWLFSVILGVFAFKAVNIIPDLVEESGTLKKDSLKLLKYTLGNSKINVKKLEESSKLMLAKARKLIPKSDQEITVKEFAFNRATLNLEFKLLEEYIKKTSKKDYKTYFSGCNKDVQHIENMLCTYRAINTYLDTKVFSRIHVSQLEIINYYHENIDQFYVLRSARIQHIFSINQKEIRKAASLVKKLPFMRLVAKFSEAPEAKHAGYLEFTENEYPVVFNTVFSLKNKQISRVTASQHGYHLFKLIWKKPPRFKSLDESDAEIYKIIKKQKSRSLYSSLIRKAFKVIRINISRI